MKKSLGFWTIIFLFCSLSLLLKVSFKEPSLTRRTTKVSLSEFDSNSESATVPADRWKCDDTRMHQLSCKNPYMNRTLHVQELCKTRKTLPFEWEEKKYYYVNRLEVAMCAVPKAASTTWKTLLLKLQETLLRNSTENTLNTTLRDNSTAKGLSKKAALQKLYSYTRFMISRHPFERLVSAYLDKFTNRAVNHFYRKRFGIMIALFQAKDYLHGIVRKLKFKEPNTCKTLVTNMTFLFHNNLESSVRIKEADKYGPTQRTVFLFTRPENLPDSEESVRKLKNFKKLYLQQQKEVLNYVKIINTGEIKFEQFIRYVISKRGRLRLLDVHWIPQTLLCQPCLVNYTYILRFDDIEKDSNRLLDYLQEYKLNMTNLTRPSEKFSFPKRKNAVNVKLTQQYFDRVPKKDTKILRNIYRDDFKFFNFDPYKYHGIKTK